MVQLLGGFVDPSYYGDSEVMNSLINIGEVGKYLSVRVCGATARNGQDTSGGVEL